MKTLYAMAATIFVALLATNSWGTSNLNLSKSNVNREFPNASIVTASVNLGASESAILYNTPDKGDFILTQFCASPDATGGIRLDATKLGSVAQSGSTSCITFTPGVSIPHSSTVSCTTNAAAAAAASPSSTNSAAAVASFFCSISGMQTTK